MIRTAVRALTLNVYHGEPLFMFLCLFSFYPSVQLGLVKQEENV